MMSGQEWMVRCADACGFESQRSGNAGRWGVCGRFVRNGKVAVCDAGGEHPVSAAEGEGKAPWGLARGAVARIWRSGGGERDVWAVVAAACNPSGGRKRRMWGSRYRACGGVWRACPLQARSLPWDPAGGRGCAGGSEEGIA